MFKIAVPTHRRSDTIQQLTLSVLDGIDAEVYIFISDEEDYKQYEEKLPNHNLILCHTKNVKEKFNFIQNYFDEGTKVVVIEDDIQEIKNLYGHSLKQSLEYINEYCKENEIEAWGIYPSSNEFFMQKTIYEGLVYIVANMYGFTSRRDDKLLCRLNTKNDYERSVKYWEVYGKLARFNFISCLTKNYTNKGGMQLSDNREKDEYEASNHLVDIYPNIFTINEGRKSKYTEIKMKKIINKHLLSEETPYEKAKRKRKMLKRDINKPWMIR